MKALGQLLLIGGISFGLVALNMDTSVKVDYPMGNMFNLPERVNNLGLMNDRQNYLIFSGIISIVGVIMIFSRKPSPEEFARYKREEVNYSNNDNQISIPDSEEIEATTIKSHQNKISQLKQLKQLLDEKILTQEEFEQQKTQILVS